MYSLKLFLNLKIENNALKIVYNSISVSKFIRCNYNPHQSIEDYVIVFPQEIKETFAVTIGNQEFSKEVLWKGKVFIRTLFHDTFSVMRLDKGQKTPSGICQIWNKKSRRYLMAREINKLLLYVCNSIDNCVIPSSLH